MKILCYLLLLYVSHVLSDNVYPWSAAKEGKKLICNTAECEKIGDMYTKHINPTKNPCTDFYDYACGNWETINPMPPDADEWNARAVQERGIQRMMKPILENEAKHTKLGVTYKYCMKRPALGQMSIDKIMTYVEKIEDWPTFSGKNKPMKNPWWAIDDYYISHAGESALFDMQIVYKDERQRLPLFRLMPLLSAYGRIIRFYPWEDTEMQAYIELLKELINACSKYKHTKKTKVSKKDLTDVISFRLELENIAAAASQKNGQVIRMTVDDLQHVYERKRLKSKAEPMDWLKVMRSMYENNSPGLINMHTEVELQNYEYFSALAKLLDKTPEDIIVNHIHLYFVERHLLLDPIWRKKLKKTIYNVQPCVAKKGRIRTLHERWTRCLISLRTLPDFNNLFVQTLISPDTRKTVKDVVSDFKSVVALDILDSDWMDIETKDKAISKVNNMQAWLGHREGYDFPRLKEKFRKAGTSPLDANACVQYDYNAVFLAAGMFSPPLGCISQAFPVTYATVGFLVGHESYHGFDTNGISFNSKGANNGQWWSSQMLKKYDKQKQCFMDQYEQFLTRELRAKKSQPCNVKESYNENMADLMGVKVAYQLYRKALYEKEGTCYIPPQLKDFTCEQLFFIAFANTQCSLASTNAIKYSTMDRGSPHRYRVNAPLMNMKEFSEAFHCQEKDTMQLPPASRCDLWTRQH